MSGLNLYEVVINQLTLANINSAKVVVKSWGKEVTVKGYGFTLGVERKIGYEDTLFYRRWCE